MKETNKKEWCVYIHTNKANNKVYIGQTSLKPEKRWEKNGKGYLDLKDDGSYNQPAMAYAILKYPDWDNGWTHEVVADNLTQEEANELEIKLIAMYKSNCSRYKDPPFGYNMTDGGQGAHGIVLSEETKRKISEANSDPSQETRQKMSNSAKERCTEEWAIENSKMQSGKRKSQCSHPCSEEIKQIIQRHNSKSIYQKTLDGQIINEFVSQSEAERITGVAQASIWRCCNKKVKSAGGYDWDYVDASNELHNNRMQKVVQLDLDGNYLREWDCAAYAENALSIPRGKVTMCCKGQRRSTGGYRWMYKIDWEQSQLTIQNELEDMTYGKEMGSKTRLSWNGDRRDYRYYFSR